MSTSGPLFQNSIYVGINLQDIMYGIELVLYFRTMHLLLSSRLPHQKIDVFYAAFSSVMLLMVTIWIATQAIFGEKMWLENVNYPGGADGYWATNNAIWYMDFGTTAITVLQLMTDALMIYRCRLICDSYRIIIVPVILWLGTLALGILSIWASGTPGGNFFIGFAAQLGLAYYSVSVGLTGMLTLMICFQIVRHGRMMKKHLGQDYASVYFALFSVIVESVLPYTLSGVAFLVSFGIGSATSTAIGCVYVMLMAISPQMLILRVASGLGWNEGTTKAPPSTLKLAPLEGSESVWTESHCFDERGGAKETV